MNQTLAGVRSHKSGCCDRDPEAPVEMTKTTYRRLAVDPEHLLFVFLVV